jgi:hypothetical protein
MINFCLIFFHKKHHPILQKLYDLRHSGSYIIISKGGMYLSVLLV